MKQSELLHILAAIIIFAIIGSFSFLLESNWLILPKVFLFSAILIFVSVFARKLMANALDSDVEHEIWKVSRYGLKQHQRIKREIPAGIIFPLLLSVFSLGFIKFPALLTYESRALQRR